MPDLTLPFPPGFLWGSATAAHQVEGNNRLNDWWGWEHLPGRILDGTRSGDACDHWNRYEQDFDLLHALHQNAHRFSLEWSRIEPQPGRFDDAAIEHYRQVIRALRARGIEPVVTLHHFTNPAWLARRGGWTSNETPYRFEQYVRYVLRALRGEVRYWLTVNEPNIYAYTAFVKGTWPPQARSLRLGYRVIRQLLRGHARAYRAIHEIDPRPEVQVGFAHSMQWYAPWGDRSPADRLGAWLHATASNWRILDAFVEGRLRFPLGFGEPVPELPGTLDFLGLNYYMRLRVRFSPRLLDQGMMYLGPTPGVPTSLYEWELYPPGLFYVLQRTRRYGWPVMVTENGVADSDDSLRPGYLVSHLAQLHRAIAAGQTILGYQHWTSFDNFEWAQGFRMRFGLIHVDFQTQERTVKPSGRLYGEIAGAGAITAAQLRQYGRWEWPKSAAPVVP